MAWGRTAAPQQGNAASVPERRLHADAALELDAKRRRRAELRMMVVQQVLTGDRHLEMLRGPPSEAAVQLRVRGDSWIRQRADAAQGEVQLDASWKIDVGSESEHMRRIVGFSRAASDIAAVDVFRDGDVEERVAGPHTPDRQRLQ